MSTIDKTQTACLIIGLLKEREKSLINLRDRLVRNNRSARALDNAGVSSLRSQMFGMMDVCDTLAIDRKEFNWIIDL